jgi:hypothetical protein
LLTGLLTGSGFTGLPATWAAQLSGKAGINILARLMTSKEGLSALRGYARAVGTGKGDQIAFWGARVGELAEREATNLPQASQ